MDDGEDVSPTRWPRSTPQKHFSASGTRLCQKLSKPQGLLRLKGLGKFIKLIYVIGSRSRDLPVLQPLCYRVHSRHKIVSFQFVV
jgi:hypothetical protein